MCYVTIIHHNTKAEIHICKVALEREIVSYF